MSKLLLCVALSFSSSIALAIPKLGICGTFMRYWVADDPYSEVDDLISAREVGLPEEAFIERLITGYEKIGAQALWKMPYDKTGLRYWGNQLRAILPGVASDDIRDALDHYEEFEK